MVQKKILILINIKCEEIVNNANLYMEILFKDYQTNLFVHMYFERRSKI